MGMPGTLPKQDAAELAPPPIMRSRDRAAMDRAKCYADMVSITWIMVAHFLKEFQKKFGFGA